MKVSNVDVTRKPTKEQIEMLNKVADLPLRSMKMQEN